MAATLTQAVEGVDRGQITLFPECLEDRICEDNPVRVIDVFVGGLDLPELKKELPFSVLHRAGKSPPRPPLLSSVAWTNR